MAKVTCASHEKSRGNHELLFPVIRYQLLEFNSFFLSFSLFFASMGTVYAMIMGHSHETMEKSTSHPSEPRLRSLD